MRWNSIPCVTGAFMAKLRSMDENNFIDQHTRILVISFNLYSPPRAVVIV